MFDDVFLIGRARRDAALADWLEGHTETTDDGNRVMRLSATDMGPPLDYESIGGETRITQLLSPRSSAIVAQVYVDDDGYHRPAYTLKREALELVQAAERHEDEARRLRSAAEALEVETDPSGGTDG